MNVSSFQTRIDSVDIAALLLSLGFKMQTFRTYTTKSVDSLHVDEDKRAYWEFSPRSQYNSMELSDVLRKYRAPARGEEPANICERAFVVDKNYQALKSITVLGKPLFQQHANNYIILNNTSGQRIRLERYGEPASVTDFDVVAISAALGCTVSRACINNGVVSVDMMPSPDGVTAHSVMECKRSPEVRDVRNFATMPVLLAMMSNRRALMDSIHDKRLVLCRGQKKVTLSDKMDDSFISKILSIF